MSMLTAIRRIYGGVDHGRTANMYSHLFKVFISARFPSPRWPLMHVDQVPDARGEP